MVGVTLTPGVFLKLDILAKQTRRKSMADCARVLIEEGLDRYNMSASA